jgi:hypothetical protein
VQCPRRAQRRGVTADDLAALTNQLGAGLEQGTLDRIEAAARGLSSAVAAASADLGHSRRSGVPACGHDAIRGRLATLDDT